MNKVFIDSSILIESFKGNDKAIDIIRQLVEERYVMFINPIVFSEVIYISIKYC